MTAASEKPNFSLDQFLTATGDLAYVWDLETDKITWVGTPPPSWTHLPDTGDALHELLHPNDLLVRLQLLSTHFTEGGIFDCEYRVSVGEGEYIWFHDRAHADVIGVGRAASLMGVLRVVTARKQRQEYLEYRSNYDALTGYFNKHRFCEALTQALNYAKHYNISASYLAVAIDNLDMINLAYGFNAANSVIVELARRIKSWLNPTDIIGRVSGNCYGIIVEHCGSGDIQDVAIRLLQLIRQNPFETEAGPVHITVSIGGVVFPDQGEQTDEVMTHADSAIAKAKRQGVGSFVMYKSTDQQYQQRKQDMMINASVQKAMVQDRLRLAFQPVVNRNRDVCFYEALIRMIGPNGDVVKASRFVPVAERLGWARLLDIWVMEAAARELIQHPNLRLAINMSALTVGNDEWLQCFKEAFSPRPQAASQLIIEITETAMMHSFEKSQSFIDALRQLGPQIALDDFGAGYTSFLYLSKLNIDYVKIDHGFIHNIQANSDSMTFIHTLIDISKARNIKVIAECIETQQELEVLLQQSIDFFQGHFFGEAVFERPWVLK
jgi:diguanylate cyclase (GGDEF)-like protein